MSHNPNQDRPWPADQGQQDAHAANQPGPQWAWHIPQQGQPGRGDVQPMQRGGHAQPGAHGRPLQRTYAQPRFSPAVTQEMRVRAEVQQHAGGPVNAPWAAQAARRMPREDPSAGADIARIIVGVVVGTGLLLGFIGILTFGVFAFEGMGPLVIALSAIPLAFIILMVLWFDRWKPQPKLLLAVCLLWGAVASVIMTFIASFLGIFALAMVGIDASGDVFGAVVMAPVIEEITKSVLLVVIVLTARKYFEGPLDGWVYGTLVGAGFAFTENILYLGGAYIEYAEAGLWTTFVMRCLLSPLLHSAFVACAGISIGLAARRGAWWFTVVMWIPGLFAGMLLHGVWNGMATLTANLPFLIAIVVIILLSALIAVGWFVSGLVLRYNEAKHTRQLLGDYANAGWLTHPEVDMLGTWKGRRAGTSWASRFPGAKQHMKSMIAIAANLAATRTRVLAGVGGNRERAVELYLLDQFTGARSALMAAVNRRDAQVGSSS